MSDLWRQADAVKPAEAPKRKPTKFALVTAYTIATLIFALGATMLAKAIVLVATL